MANIAVPRLAISWELQQTKGLWIENRLTDVVRDRLRQLAERSLRPTDGVANADALHRAAQPG